VVVRIAPFWVPYTHAYPPVLVAPPQPLYVQLLPPQPYQSYCDNPQGFYPFVAQCTD